MPKHDKQSRQSAHMHIREEIQGMGKDSQHSEWLDLIWPVVGHPDLDNAPPLANLLVIDEAPWGYCPVQSGGRIDNRPWYFRARNAHWELRVGEEDAPAGHVSRRDMEWGYCEEYGREPDAGRMPHEIAAQFIDKGLRLFLVSDVNRKSQTQSENASCVGDGRNT